MSLCVCECSQAWHGAGGRLPFMNTDFTRLWTTPTHARQHVHHLKMWLAYLCNICTCTCAHSQGSWKICDLSRYLLIDRGGCNLEKCLWYMEEENTPSPLWCGYWILIIQPLQAITQCQTQLASHYSRDWTRCHPNLGPTWALSLARRIQPVEQRGSESRNIIGVDC